MSLSMQKQYISNKKARFLKMIVYKGKFKVANLNRNFYYIKEKSTI